ncbi:MAG: branched-chain amino acid ABC transporter permease [Actinomycetota bacterium]|nr:branched-chain amino acid ABC transporter permease [Actinomycetota bacterium]
MRRLRLPLELIAPCALVLAVGLGGKLTSVGTQTQFWNALVNVTIVVALYVFVGNSGVLSFGHISFVALGAFAAGLMTVETLVKPNVMPELNSFLAKHSIANVPSLLLAAGLGALFALLVGLPLMRLSGLAAGIATFAVLEITHNVLQYWTEIGPGATTLALVPQTTAFGQATLGALIAVVVAFGYQKSRWGRQLRATREDPAAAQAAGIDIHRQRLIAFTLSGGLAGLAGGLLVHLLGSINVDQVYLDLTFLTLAMLVVGGAQSLFGAVVGALGVSLLDTFLGNAEDGTRLLGLKLDFPGGARLIGVAAAMVVVILLRPSGLTGGREFSFRLPRRPASGRAAAEPH